MDKTLTPNGFDIKLKQSSKHRFEIEWTYRLPRKHLNKQMSNLSERVMADFTTFPSALPT